MVVPLAACVSPAQQAPGAAALRGLQEAACAAAIAAHVGRPRAEVRVRWLSATDGMARIEAQDGNRRHLCVVDGAARVLGYSHPGA